MTADAVPVVVSPGACDVAAIKARLVAAEPVFDGRGYFEHLAGSPCGEHRTVGEHRSWCYVCREWCYASVGCAGCRPDVDADDALALVAEVERLRAALNAVRDGIAEQVRAFAAQIEASCEYDEGYHDGLIRAVAFVRGES